MSRNKPDAVAAALKAACQCYPEMRTAQILVNALGRDPFYLEDEDMIVGLYAYCNAAAEYHAPDSTTRSAMRGEPGGPVDDSIVGSRLDGTPVDFCLCGGAPKGMCTCP